MKGTSMRHLINSLLLSTYFVTVAHCQGFPDANDVVTIIYDPSDGSLVVNNPAGDDAAADAITTFELTSSVPFFTGPRPPELNGLFDVWSPTKAFRLDPDGFFDMEWPAGTVATGVNNAGDILTLSGSFLSGGPLEPVRLCVGVCIPEPGNLVPMSLGAFALVAPLRRRK